MADRIGRITIHPYDLGAKADYYTRAPNRRWADPGPPLFGGRPIHGLPTLVGISDMEIPNVVRVRWGYTDRASDKTIQAL